VFEKEEKNVSTSKKQRNRWFDHQNENGLLRGGAEFSLIFPYLKKTPHWKFSFKKIFGFQSIL